MSEAEPGAGNIMIELDGKPMELVPTVQACIAISAIAGGLNAAAQRCAQLDMDTICKIVIAGLGLNPVQAKQVPTMVFNTGLFMLSGPCIDFINVVGNGGRPLPPEGAGEGDESPLMPESR